jgi:hypothetical protein
MTKVHVLGPNLATNGGETFHVHAEGCADVHRSRIYASADHEWDRKNAYDFGSLDECVKDTYHDQIYSDHAGEDPDQISADYASDFKVFPCVKWSDA